MISRKQFELHNNSYELSGDLVRFRDPFTGDYLEPGIPPRSIEAQPNLKAGLDYLRHRGSDVELTIFASAHGDSDHHDTKEVKQVVGAHDAVFLELIGATPDIEALFYDIASGSGAHTTQATLESIGDYKVRQLQAVAGSKIPILFPEVKANGSRYEQELLEYIDLLNELRPIALAGDANFALATEINIIGTSIMREWYMLANMGYQMAIAENAGYKISSPLLWIGSLHGETLPAKCEGLGIATRVEFPEFLDRRSPENKLHGFDDFIDFTTAARDAVARVRAR